jgi:Protein of unknown function (DUF2628)
MSVYTVHEPPLRTAAPRPNEERIVFVREGFSFWAFLLAPVWMIWHRMWSVLIIYLVIGAAILTPMVIFAASPAAIAIVVLLISLLVGLEASTLRRLTLWRRGWTAAGIVSGDGLEDAERRFFDAWVRRSVSPPSTGASAAAAATGAATAPRQSQSPDVIGLFPKPGVGQ